MPHDGHLDSDCASSQRTPSGPRRDSSPSRCAASVPKQHSADVLVQNNCVGTDEKTSSPISVHRVLPRTTADNQTDSNFPLRHHSSLASFLSPRFCTRSDRRVADRDDREKEMQQQRAHRLIFFFFFFPGPMRQRTEEHNLYASQYAARHSAHRAHTRIGATRCCRDVGPEAGP